MNQIEEIINKVNDLKLLAMNFACWAEEEESDKLWKVTYCLKDCLDKLQEIAREET